jgi:uncharacterized membrane protein
MPVLIILSRWLHVATACVAVGGVFFVRVILPIGLSVLDPPQRSAAFLKTRRAFKMVIHSSILLLLLTGIFNTTVAWDKYNLNPTLLQSLWGTHLLLALVAFSIALYVLAGKEPRAKHSSWMTLNLIVLFLAVLAASSLKWAREKAVADHAQSSAVHQP